MHEIKTEIEINAPAHRVWSILVTFAAYPSWNPFIRKIRGPLNVGEKLKVFVHPPGGKGMTFNPTVLTAKPDQELRWRGHLLIPGLFDGEHYFRIDSSGENQVRFIHGEVFSGLIVPLFKSSLDTGTRAGFEAMNQALKSKAEANSF